MIIDGRLNDRLAHGQVSPNASGLAAPLGALDLLHPHKHVDFAVLPASLLPRAQLVLAKVLATGESVILKMPLIFI
jgi:hypothetical protein